MFLHLLCSLFSPYCMNFQCCINLAVDITNRKCLSCSSVLSDFPNLWVHLISYEMLHICEY